jgi:hypothetical protein
MPLDNVVGAFAVLSDELHAPVLPRLLSIYIRGIGAEAETETEALPDPGFVCPASLKARSDCRFPFEDVEAIEDLGRFGKGELYIPVMGDICLTTDCFLSQNERTVGIGTDGLNKFVTLRPRF